MASEQAKSLSLKGIRHYRKDMGIREQLQCPVRENSFAQSREDCDSSKGSIELDVYIPSCLRLSFRITPSSILSKIVLGSSAILLRSVLSSIARWNEI